MRKHFWRRYGWFTLLIFLGSVGGAINAAAGIEYRSFFQRINRSVDKNCEGDSPIDERIACYIDKVSWMSQGAYWFSVSYVPYGIEFLCLCCATLLVTKSLLQHTHLQLLTHRALVQVIERMVDFVTMAETKTGRLLKIAARVAMVCATLSNLVNISLLAVAVNHQVRASVFFSKTGAALKDPLFMQEQLFPCFFLQKCDAVDNFVLGTDQVNHALRVQGYASICEGFSLVVILVSFVFAGAYCLRRFRATNLTVRETVQRQNNSVRFRIVVTVFTVFVSFLMRSLYACILAISRNDTSIQLPVFTDASEQCDNTCEPCQHIGVIVQSWFFYTPEFSEVIILVASPLTMLIAQWGMTSPHFVQKLRERFRKQSLAEERAFVSRL